MSEQAPQTSTEEMYDKVDTAFDQARQLDAQHGGFHSPKALNGEGGSKSPAFSTDSRKRAHLGLTGPEVSRSMTTAGTVLGDTGVNKEATGGTRYNALFRPEEKLSTNHSVDERGSVTVTREVPGLGTAEYHFTNPDIAKAVVGGAAEMVANQAAEQTKQLNERNAAEEAARKQVQEVLQTPAA